MKELAFHCLRMSSSSPPPSDILVFYSKSANVKPGKGAHESVSVASQYAHLMDHDHWRRVLSNFHVGAFAAGPSHTFMTIEHAFQFYKIGLVDRERAQQFTVESGSELGRGNGEAAQKARKMVVLSPMDLQIWEAQKDVIMEEMATLKFQACPEAAAVLAATGNAELWHLVTRRGKRSTLVRFEHLERIRALINLSV